MFLSIEIANSPEYCDIDTTKINMKITEIFITSLFVTEDMLPKRYDSNEFPPGAKSDNIAAIPSPVLIMTAVAISPYCGNFFLINSIKNAATTQTIAEPTNGSNPKISPSPTPLRAV